MNTGKIIIETRGVFGQDMTEFSFTSGATSPPEDTIEYAITYLMSALRRYRSQAAETE